jgi:hypothetical protein
MNCLCNHTMTSSVSKLDEFEDNVRLTVFLPMPFQFGSTEF